MSGTLDIDDEGTWPLCETCGYPFWPSDTEPPRPFYVSIAGGQHRHVPIPGNRQTTCPHCVLERFEDAYGYNPD